MSKINFNPSLVGSTQEHCADPQRVGYLDGWRGLAIVLVLQSHFLPIAGFDTGQLGVALFFCLSGRLMSEILFIKRVPLATFYKRRISRLLPAFLLFVCAVFGTTALIGESRSSTEFIATLLFLRTYYPQEPGIWSSGLPIGHLWSLNVEEHCYVFLGLLTLWAAVREREAWVLAAAAGASMAAYYLYLTVVEAPPVSFEIRTETASSFLLASAAYFLVRDRVAPWVRPWMPVAALAVAALGFQQHPPWWMCAVVAPLALTFSVNHLHHTPLWIQKLLAAKPLRQMGLWSYSLYLWQQPFFTYKSALPPWLPVIGALAFGLASFYLLERPSRDWLNGRWSPESTQ